MWVGGRVRIVVIVFGNQSFRVYFKRIQFLIIRQYHLFVLYFWKINYRIKCAAVVMLLVNLLANRNQAVMKWTKLRGFLEIYGTALFFPQPFSYFAYFFRALRCEIIKIAYFSTIIHILRIFPRTWRGEWGEALWAKIFSSVLFNMLIIS